MSDIKLGVVARDTITGFEGVVVGASQYLYGCGRFGIQPMALDKDGKPQEAHWFDEPQLAFVSDKPEEVTVPTQPVVTGGPRPDPERGR